MAADARHEKPRLQPYHSTTEQKILKFQGHEHKGNTQLNSARDPRYEQNLEHKQCGGTASVYPRHPSRSVKTPGIQPSIYAQCLLCASSFDVGNHFWTKSPI
jgi:hypothetical protein